MTAHRRNALIKPIFVVGDINIHLERPGDPTTVQFTDLLADRGLTCRVTSSTHDRGGTLDVNATRDDLPPPPVEVVDVGLSDHWLLRWTTSLVKPSPVYTTRTSRPSLVDAAEFRAVLRSSLLCRPDAWTDCDVDGLARLYNTEISMILDRLAPARTVTCRQRSSDPWFDDECRQAKRRVRQLERASRRTGATAVSATEWTAERREYRALLRRKREALWTSKIDSERSSPRQLWRSVDTLLGRCRVPPPQVLGAADFHQHFDQKVADVRALTEDAAPSPLFSPAPPDCRFVDFQSLTIDDVVAAIRVLPDKQCTSDPIPTHLLKDCADIVRRSLRSCSSGVYGWVRYRICRFYPSCSSALFHGNSWITQQRQGSCLHSSRLTGGFILPRLQSLRFWRTSCAHWTTATLQYSRCLTCQQHSTRSTSPFCYSGWRRPMASEAAH